MMKLPYLLKCQLSEAGEIDQMEQRYTTAKPLIELIVQTLDDTLAKEVKEADSEKMFEDPNWAYRNAYLAGYREGLRTSRKIITKE